MLTTGMICVINAPTELSGFRIDAPQERLQTPKIVKLVSIGTDLALPSHWKVQAVDNEDMIFAVYDAWLVEAENCLRFFSKCPRRVRAGWYRECGGICP